MSRRIATPRKLTDDEKARAFFSLSDPNQRADVLVEVYKMYGMPQQFFNKITGKMEGFRNARGELVNGSGSTVEVIAIRRKNFVSKDDLITRSKAVEANLGSYLRHSALLLRTSNNFMSYILYNKGRNSSVVARFKNIEKPIVMSYDDFNALHDYVINQKVRKLVKYVSYARMRLGGSSSGVNALSYPCYLSDAMKRVINDTVTYINGTVADGDLKRALIASVKSSDTGVFDINSRNVLKEFFVRSVRPDATSGTFVTFPRDHPFLRLLETVSPFVGLTKKLEKIQEQANVVALTDGFIRAAAKSNKNKKIKEVYSEKRERIYNQAEETYSQILERLKLNAAEADRKFNGKYSGELGYKSNKLAILESLYKNNGDSIRINSYVVSIICSSFTWGKGDINKGVPDNVVIEYFRASMSTINDQITARVEAYKLDKKALKEAGEPLDRSRNPDVINEIRAQNITAAFKIQYGVEINARDKLRTAAINAKRKAGTKVVFNPTVVN